MEVGQEEITSPRLRTAAQGPQQRGGLIPGSASQVTQASPSLLAAHLDSKARHDLPNVIASVRSSADVSNAVRILASVCRDLTKQRCQWCCQGSWAVV